MIPESSAAQPPYGPTPFMMRMSLADVLKLTMLGTLISVSTTLFKLPIGVPGHSSIYWMALLILGKAVVPRLGAGTLMGMVSGILAVLLGMSKGGMLVGVKYLAPGLALDLLAPLMMYRFDIIWLCAVAGAVISVAKLLVSMAAALMFRLPMGAVKTGLAYASVLHLVFGFLGGILAWLLIKRLTPRMKPRDKEGPNQ